MQIELTPSQRVWSKLQFDIAVQSLNVTPPIEFLVISFTGDYGFGSAGNEDALFMEAVVKAAWKAYPSAKVAVFDLRKLRYEWGDEIDRAFRGTITAIVISDLNREGLTSLVEQEWSGRPEEHLFETMEDAISYLERGFKNQIFVWHYDDSKRSELIVEAGQPMMSREYRDDNLILEKYYYQDKIHFKNYLTNGELDFEEDFDISLESDLNEEEEPNV